MVEQRPARLEDVLNYRADEYFDETEMSIIRGTFKDPKVMKILRKALLPSVGDRELPLEEMGNDVWLSGTDYKSVPDAEIKSIVLGRQEAIKFVIGGLVKLKIIANTKAENEQQRRLRMAQDSAK